MRPHIVSDQALAAAITREASRQTDFTIRFLVDRELVGDAYRAYAYFRWVDDWLDQGKRPLQERVDFVSRQVKLFEACGIGKPPEGLTQQEKMLVNLAASERVDSRGLSVYIRNMMAVMAFDAERRGRLISERELESYTGWLATAVTEAMHTFIGPCCFSPRDASRYQAVSGAHITHMLRDALEDADTGYFNIPREILSTQRISPEDVASPAYRNWVKERVLKARECFRMGSEYLAQVECLRCRLAGFAYMRRFQIVLDCIEREGYVLRRQYPERKEGGRWIEMIGQALWMTMKPRRSTHFPTAYPTR